MTKGGRAQRSAAARLPVARVCVDVPLAHLDRPFDYLVAEADDEAAQPGVRVKVRFAGQLVGGFLLERAESSAHEGKLAFLDKVVSPERVLDPEVARLARAVADRYAGNLCDVLRLAVPPRHARVESQRAPAGDEAADQVPDQVSVQASDEVSVEPADQASDQVSVQASDQVSVQPTDQAAGEVSGQAPVQASDQVSVPAAAAVQAAGEVSSQAPDQVSVRAAGQAAGQAAGEVSGEAAGQVSDQVSVRAAVQAARQISGQVSVRAAVQVSDQVSGQVSDRAAGEALGQVGAEEAAGPHPLSDAAQSGAGTALAGVGGHRSDYLPGRAGDASVPVPGGPGDGSDHPAGVAGAGRAGETSALVGVEEAASDPDGWGAYATGGSFLRALADGRSARGVWSALPGEDWPARIAEACAAVVRAGRGAVVLVADARDLERVDRALEAALGSGKHVALNAAAGPSERYRRFLAASRHQVPVVVGTRAAMFAPVPKLGLVVIWDDGDDLYAEQRAPYPHAREVLLTRAQLAGCAALLGGFARTGEAQLLLETGWAHEIVAGRDVARRRTPRIQPTGDDPQLARDPGAATARLPSLAWQAARSALQAGAPVLVQVPRRGYVPSTACADCRTPARCPHCSGPLELAGARDLPACRWCGRASAGYACPACGGRRLRASVTGARRTAEELGRAFPGATVRTSGRDEVLGSVPAGATVVVSTPGAEPVAEGGYGAVLLLDTWALLTRSDLRAGEEAMRRWLNAAALARADGTVIVVADGSLVSVQALLRWDAGWFAARELSERRELRFPPAARMADVTGPAAAVAELLGAARLPEGTELLGPVPAADDQERMLLRVARGRAAELAHALHEASAMRSARKAAQAVRIQVDPATLF